MTAVFGLLVVALAGALNGTFALPMKATTRWAWENTWLVYSAVGMVIVSWGVAWSTVPDLPAVYADAGAGVIGMVFAFGLLWGMANLLFGMGIHLVGIGLAFPITIGMSLALGSLLTMVAQDPAAMLSPGGLVTVLGVIVIIAGVIASALAGVRRDRNAVENTASTSNGGTTAHRGLILGLCVVILAGFFDPMLNFAFQFGGKIEAAAMAHGANALAGADALWVWPLSGSFVVNMIYCSFLLTRNRTWCRYWQPGALACWTLAALMGVIWMSSISLYGRGASMMGIHGKSVGWAVFYCAIILFSALWGMLCGEWRNANRRTLQILYTGLAMLLAAFAILAYGNHLLF